VPVVASALPEMERIVRSYGVGWCVAPGDANALASVLRHALRQRGEDSMLRRLALAASELNWSREQVRLTELYASL